MNEELYKLLLLKAVTEHAIICSRVFNIPETFVSKLEEKTENLRYQIEISKEFEIELRKALSDWKKEYDV